MRMPYPAPLRTTGSVSTSHRTVRTDRTARSARVGLAAALAAGLAVGLSACGSGDPLKTTPSVGGGASAGTAVVGSANFPESVLLGEIYAQALSAKGVQVTKKLRIGTREAYVPALKNGELTVFPEYTGNFARYLNPKATGTDPAAVLTDLKAALPANLVALDPAKAEDKDSVTVTKATADKYGLKTIADLAPVAKNLIIGGPPEWETRSYGVPGLKETYGLVFKEFKPLDSAGTLCVEALDRGTVDVVNLYSTDPSIAAKGFVSLEDPKSFFLPQQVVPVVAKDIAANATAAGALNAVSAKLDTPTLARMVKEVVADKKDAADVAAAFLKDNGLS